MIDEQEIHAYVDGRLDAAGRQRVEAWLAHHPVRAKEVHRWRQDAQQLRAALGALPDAAGQAMLDPATVRNRRARRRRSRLAVTAVLLLTLAAGLAGGWHASGWLAPAPAAPMADAVQAYRMFAGRDQALDMTPSHSGALQSWLERHFQHPGSLPNLQAAGFHAVGARLIATSTGAAAMVVYKNTQGKTIGFYIRPPSPSRGRLQSGRRRDGQLTVAYWSGDGYNYALVGQAGAPALRAPGKAS